MTGAHIPNNDKGAISLIAVAAKRVILRHWNNTAPPTLCERLMEIKEMIRLERLAHSLGTGSYSAVPVLVDCDGKSLPLSQCLPENITHLDLSPGFMKLSGSEQQRVLRNFRRLVSLSLANSFLPVLREEMFSSFENLQALDLSNCSVRQVDPRALGGLPRLATLVLKDNRIRRLDPGVWPDLEGLSALDLRNNLLTGVDGPLMHALGRIGRVRLEGNKWRCDCQLLPMQQWLKSRKGK
nr:PREDICTED: leucine-rich repeat-containing protein 19-like [Latimeria chalumnae]|eukprot:XP_014339745.1 PREDICTED: leucine-rich repeat-containing protein 19-like [Latimeria chalumnae]